MEYGYPSKTTEMYLGYVKEMSMEYGYGYCNILFECGIRIFLSTEKYLGYGTNGYGTNRWLAISFTNAEYGYSSQSRSILDMEQMDMEQIVGSQYPSRTQNTDIPVNREVSWIWNKWIWNKSLARNIREYGYP
jgi:hypothetical protein